MTKTLLKGCENPNYPSMYPQKILFLCKHTDLPQKSQLMEITEWQHSPALFVSMPFFKLLTLEAPKRKTADLANSIYQDEAAHFEPLHLNPHCSPSFL